MESIHGIDENVDISALAGAVDFDNYPTNPALLIALRLADVSYSDWFRWGSKFRILNLVLTSLLLIFGLTVGY